MKGLGQAALALYAVALLIGGILGAQKSPISLIAGGIGALVVFGALMLTRTQPKVGFALGFTAAVSLAINFFMRYQKTQAFYPSGLFLLISIAALIAVGIAMARRTA